MSRSTFADLEEKFEVIKKMGAVKSLRDGYTGAGYTFETLLGKKEDQESVADYKGIEIKTHLGYSKSDLSMFHNEPKRKNDIGLNYLFANYSYASRRNSSKKMLSLDLYADKFTHKYYYDFKLKIDYIGKKIILQVYKNSQYIEDACYWDFKDLEIIVNKKMKRLAIIETYPYRKDNEMYFKYFTMKKYVLKGFWKFLKLIENGEIYIRVYATKDTTDEFIQNHGTNFRIKYADLNKLFYKVK